MPIATQEILNAVYDQTNNLLRTSLSNGGTINGNVTIPSPNTLTLGAMTLGSVIFAGTGGVLSQNNANFFWDNTNTRLGIGTTSPSSALHVKGPITAQQVGDGGTNISWMIADGTQKWSAYLSNGSIIWYDTANRITFLIGGNVGIGTTQPVNKLDINGGIAIGSYAGVNAGPSNGLIVSGNVGIGTTNPSRLLHVAGRYQLGGTAIATTDWALTSGWGANATISAVTGTDSRGTVTVTTSALDTPSANPVITLTFKDGTWTTTPFIMANMQHASTGPSTVPATCQATPTTLVISYRGTPTATSALTYIFNYMVVG